ncbi:MAG: Jag N-terminal domain-containing protein [Candidatus Cloacimonetes bacterium]|nr:Jag N-terminal domain-containing protein [Candidatus Cloacimonadota bacterium]
MKVIEREGKSTAKIISGFMKEHNLTLEDFKFEVIEEGSSSFLNLFGSKPTKVKFILKDSEENLKNYTIGLLKLLEINFTDIEISRKDKEYHISIKGSNNPGFIIGKSAKLLDSIQHILNQMINKQEKKQLHIKLDVDGYRERKRTALLAKVKSIADKVQKKNRSITLEPLNSANRRIVHQFIEKNSDLKTMTIGDGEFKRVVILPAGKIKPAIKNK